MAHVRSPALRPMCFVAMPFGKKAPPGRKAPVIDFDRVHRVIATAVESAGLEVIRADFERSGGFIQRAMFERLLVAEYVIADVTFANPNVMYEVGVRHGASTRATIVVCAGSFAGHLPFDLAPLRALTYRVSPSGTLGATAAAELSRELGERLRLAGRGELPVDNPLVQVTAWRPAGRVEHQKTDVFLARLRMASAISDRVADALSCPPDQAAARLDEVAEAVAADDAVEQLHTALLAIYLGYRETKAFDRMVAFYERLPRELRSTPVVQEQLALALNRLAEQAGGEDDAKAVKSRERALRVLEQIPLEHRTSETYGILGRIYKGWADATPDAAKSQAMLTRAIEAYEEGFRSDPRDYYPGVNAVTLRLLRGHDVDATALSQLLPVVRFSVSRAPKPKDEMERYWQQATKLELATASKDWSAADEASQSLLAIRARPWMRETTAGNLRRQREAFAGDVKAVRRLNGLIQSLQGGGQA